MHAPQSKVVRSTRFNNADRNSLREYLLLAGGGLGSEGELDNQRFQKGLERWQQELDTFKCLDLEGAKCLMAILDSSNLPALMKQTIKDNIDEKLQMSRKGSSLVGDRRGGAYVKQEFKSIQNYFSEDEWIAIGNDDGTATDVVVSKCLQVQCYYPSATSFTHFVIVIMLHSKSVLTRADAPRGYALGQMLRVKLGRSRPQQRHALMVVIDYPADPTALQNMNIDAYEELMNNGPLCK